MTRDMKLLNGVSLSEAKENACGLSYLFWNTYFHVVKNDNETYSVSRYYDEQAVYYYINEKCSEHIKKDKV